MVMSRMGGRPLFRCLCMVGRLRLLTLSRLSLGVTRLSVILTCMRLLGLWVGLVTGGLLMAWCMTRSVTRRISHMGRGGGLRVYGCR